MVFARWFVKRSFLQGNKHKGHFGSSVFCRNRRLVFEKTISNSSETLKDFRSGSTTSDRNTQRISQLSGPGIRNRILVNYFPEVKEDLKFGKTSNLNPNARLLNIFMFLQMPASTYVPNDTKSLVHRHQPPVDGSRIQKYSQKDPWLKANRKSELITVNESDKN